ncbi:MAG: cell division protein FtsQ/DivIB [Acidimicrobiia bacterium]
MTIHSRVLERRREVAEDRAKRNLGRLFRLLAVAAPMTLLAWVAFSPWLSVSRVEIEGAQAASVYEVLTEHRVVMGTPMILLDPGAAEAALETDPWIADATVGLIWPDEVSVSVVERVPLAWVQTRDGWSRRAHDGAVLPSPDSPDASLPSILLPEMGAGEALRSRELAGALDWIDALPARLRNGTVLTLADGELWAQVAGHDVRLGRAVEMEAKAKTLIALLDKGLPTSTQINLVAPTHPAVSRAEPGEGSDQP